MNIGRGRLPSTNSGSFFLARERILERLRARLFAVAGARRGIGIDIVSLPLWWGGRRVRLGAACPLAARLFQFSIEPFPIEGQ